jgi:hypothetical protein
MKITCIASGYMSRVLRHQILATHNGIFDRKLQIYLLNRTFLSQEHKSTMCLVNYRVRKENLMVSKMAPN